MYQHKHILDTGIPTSVVSLHCTLLGSLILLLPLLFITTVQLHVLNFKQVSDFLQSFQPVGVCGKGMHNPCVGGFTFCNCNLQSSRLSPTIANINYR